MNYQPVLHQLISLQTGVFLVWCIVITNFSERFFINIYYMLTQLLHWSSSNTRKTTFIFKLIFQITGLQVSKRRCKLTLLFVSMFMCIRAVWKLDRNQKLKLRVVLIVLVYSTTTTVNSKLGLYLGHKNAA